MRDHNDVDDDDDDGDGVPDKHVDDVDDIRGVVKDNPAQGKETVQFPEACSANDEDEVVHHSKVDDDQPFVVIRFTTVEGQVTA